jgi:hypothetical protein
MKGLEKFINQVIHGDALEVLKKIPDNSIDLGYNLSTLQQKRKVWWLVGG